MTKKNLIGLKFGKLTVIEDAPDHIRPSGERRSAWKCQCECGKNVVVTGTELQRGKTKSCGCMSTEIRTKSKTKSNNLVGMLFGYLEVLSEIEQQSGRRRWLCRCECGSLIDVRQDHLLDGHTVSCGCINSKGEKIIDEYLSKNNIKFIRQKVFDDLTGVGGGKLSYDFYLPNVNILIEYQGKQHYEPVKQFGGEEKYNIQLAHDLLKKNYADVNGITLVCIPYWDYNKISIILNRICGSTTS